MIPNAARPTVRWRPGSEAPTGYGLFWAREDFYANGVTIATHEGKGRWLVDGSDDVSVAWWAPIVYPADPGPEPDDDGDED